MTCGAGAKRKTGIPVKTPSHPILASFMIKIDFYSSSGSCHSLSLITQAFPCLACEEREAYKSGDGIKELLLPLLLRTPDSTNRGVGDGDDEDDDDEDVDEEAGTQISCCTRGRRRGLLLRALEDRESTPRFASTFSFLASSFRPAPHASDGTVMTAWKDE